MRNTHTNQSQYLKQMASEWAKDLTDERKRDQERRDLENFFASLPPEELAYHVVNYQLHLMEREVPNETDPKPFD
jgi:ferric-dicitrate binding protein FerR (iron transport regulator)